MFGRNQIRDCDLVHVPKRVHYPWHKMEEYRPDGGMWSIPAPADRGRFIDAAEELMLKIPDFEAAMRRALKEWPRSCAVALTTPGMNQRAWLGHAGCYLATGSPEETTRLGWHRLDMDEQRDANAAADAVINEWRRANMLPTPSEDWEQGGLFDA